MHQHFLGKKIMYSLSLSLINSYFNNFTELKKFEMQTVVNTSEHKYVFYVSMYNYMEDEKLVKKARNMNYRMSDSDPFWP